ncbi:hypothetical protein CKM354_000065100 [Cercospora kikuchii]|uniref:Maintenance of telomere capping protein 6 n=1 Tax=Cercospora kikuchii TaxID=84275 RepID=A0A9P3C495_9PEZI|nr:uncharacterized protein CKM354_000065100 [Cercospora kikuchii]GIZ37194.1 hypothetical protein CKM354_000065100 [Cercospora kikuchii]
MSALLYTPDPAINSTFVVQLSQRDLSLRVPVNFVTHPGVALSAACFGNRRYEESTAAKCLSNLLVSGFRRIEADVYWDASRSTWSLCPVELGGSGESLTSSASLAATPSAGLSRRLAAADNGAGRDVPLLLQQRQNDEALNPSTPPATTVTASDTISSTATLLSNPTSPATGGIFEPTDPDAGDGTLIQAGSYSCTTSTDFALLISIISAHIVNTDTNIGATTLFLTLNVHAAASASNPDGPAEQPDDDTLPEGGSLLSSIINSNVSSYIYSPRELLNQRNDLNTSSWFTTFGVSEPISEYFSVEERGNTPYTPDGWPGENYLEVPGYSKRLLVGFGTVDPQMSNYNFTGDSSTIFPAQYLESNRNVTFTSGGTVATGCFFNPEQTVLAETNSSFALSTVGSGEIVPSDQLFTYFERARNLTRCGISPILNATLGNASADREFRPYQEFANNTVWSWGPGEPVNSTGEDINDFSCAALNATSGTWKASDCSESRYGACRVGNERYSWQVSDSSAPYERVELACKEDHNFDAPRTALENEYLLSTLRRYRAEPDSDDVGELLWLNFNALDVKACWVIGQNMTCPYDGPQEEQSRRIVVPVVAGVVVFVLTGLTILIKCAGKRQTSKRRRRRGDDGWDYEGVPS